MVATFVIGNGLGMALNPDFFALRSGITAVWNEMNERDQKLIALGTNQIPIDSDF